MSRPEDEPSEEELQMLYGPMFSWYIEHPELLARVADIALHEMWNGADCIAKTAKGFAKYTFFSAADLIRLKILYAHLMELEKRIGTDKLHRWLTAATNRLRTYDTEDLKVKLPLFVARADASGRFQC